LHRASWLAVIYKSAIVLFSKITFYGRILGATINHLYKWQKTIYRRYNSQNCFTRLLMGSFHLHCNLRLHFWVNIPFFFFWQINVFALHLEAVVLCVPKSCHKWIDVPCLFASVLFSCNVKIVAYVEHNRSAILTNEKYSPFT
jgi:hypothetical protein